MIGHDGAPRPPLNEERLAVGAGGGRWREIRVVAETGSTNADVAAAAREGAAEGFVLIAEHQQSGRGRLDRSWQAPPRAGITLSVLLRPAVEPTQLGWLPLLTGVAVAEACASAAGVRIALKWPNDLLVSQAVQDNSAPEWGKAGGILVESAGSGAVVVGIGINVCQRADELPPAADPRAFAPTSLALAGSSADREQVALAVLRALDGWYARWLAAGGDAMRSGLWEDYRGNCHTIGQSVTVVLPGGAMLVGMATDIDVDGRLLVTTAEGVTRVAAGDVYHVR